jgi:hypothetical protein
MHHGKDEELAKLLAEVYDQVHIKTEFVNKVKSHSSVCTSSDPSSSFHLGFREALAIFAPNVDVWEVVFPNGVGSVTLQVWDRDALRAFILEEKSGVTPAKAPPPKVLAKMIAMRLNRAVEKAKEYHRCYINRYNYLPLHIESCEKRGDTVSAERLRKEMAESPPNYIQDMLTTTKASLRQWSVEMQGACPGHKIFKDLRVFLDREEVTEEIVRIACDMVVVQEVIES